MQKCFVSIVIKLNANYSKITYLACINWQRWKKITPIFGKGAGKPSTTLCWYNKVKISEKCPNIHEHVDVGGVVNVIMAQCSY